jgi:putative transposase
MISAVQWRKELAEGLSDSELGRLRLNTHTGRPLGSDSFLSKLESFLGRRVRPLPVGRSKKCKKSQKGKENNNK